MVYEHIFFVTLAVLPLVSNALTQGTQKNPLLDGVISVGTSGLHIPEDFGVGLLFNVLQNPNMAKIIKKIISAKCATHIDWFFENLMNATDDDTWALKMIDASTKISSSNLKLNLEVSTGNFDQCLKIRSGARPVKANYCLGTLQIDLLDSLDFASDPKAKFFSKNKDTLQNTFPVANHPSVGICIPDGCTADDLYGVVQLLNLTFNIQFECQTEDQSNPSFTTGAWAVIVFFLFIIVTMLASTTYDVTCQYTKKGSCQPLTAFSVYTNGKKLFKINKDASELSCLNGIRFLSMLWIIILHTYPVIFAGPIFNILDILQYLDTTKSMIIINAVHAVDTFFMISGLLVVYGYLKSKHMGSRFNILHFYLHRYLRLTPPFLAIILVNMYLLQYMGSGPYWPSVINKLQNSCVKNWWSALLFFQNYINVEHMCVDQTWYLNVDWQLYLCAPLFLLPLTWKPKIGLTLTLLALITFLIVPFYVTWKNELPAIRTNFYG